MYSLIKQHNIKMELSKLDLLMKKTNRLGYLILLCFYAIKDNAFERLFT